MKTIFSYTIRNLEEENEIISFQQQLKDKDKIIEDKNKVIREKNTQIVKKDSLISGLEENIIVAEEEKKNLKLKIEEKNDQIKKLKEQKHVFAARCGGYQKEQNKHHRTIDSLREELKIANEKISNFQKQLKQDHVKITPLQYDKKITTVAQHKIKMQKGR